MVRNKLMLAAALVGTLGLAACSDSGETKTRDAGAVAGATQATTAAQDRAATSAPAPVMQATPSAAASPAAAAPTAPAASPVAAQPTKLNLNTATAAQFKTIPNVGDRFVREFNEYRPYATIGQFRRELGKYVNADQIAQWEQFLYVPVNPNQADADTLRQLPGVDATVAAQLIAARPYANADAFLAKLGQLVPAAQATAARSYLVAS